MTALASLIIFYASQRSTAMMNMETMSSKDAMMFPIVGSCVLFGLFLLFKFFAKEYLNLLFTFYFLMVGVFAVGMTVYPFMEKLLGTDERDKEGNATKPLFKWVVSIPFYSEKDKPEVIAPTFNELLCYFIGTVAAVWYATTKYWLSNNIVGVCFCIQAIEMMSLGSFKNGVILLSGLF